MNETARMKMKLVMAGVSLVIALAMVSVGTFAWFTLSTAPEVTGISVTLESTGEEYPFELSLNYGIDPNTDDWTTELHVDQMIIDKYGPLRPITTYDGEHWYLPDYDGLGSVASFREVNLAEVANKVATGAAEEMTNYLVYFDMWVRTRDQNSTFALQFNNPNKNADGTYHVEDYETAYGTFALPLPKEKAGGGYEVAQNDDAMACLRIGFLVYDEENGNSFFVYEPNADKRSSTSQLGFDSNMGELVYIHGQSSAASGKTVQQGAAPETGVLATYAPRYISDDQYEMTQVDTIPQATSSWDETALAAASEINSRSISHIGEFIGGSELPQMALIDKDNVQQIRVFVWLEGQDPDCWNQISGDSIYANLEFRGLEIFE